MAGRPRQYATAAEKMAAYRARQAGRVILADRIAFEQREAQLSRLRSAITAASEAGDILARSLDTVMIQTMLEGLCEHFEWRAQQPAKNR